MTDRPDPSKRLNPSTGFICPQCGHLTRVVRTRRYGIVIIRRRTCHHCCHQFGTSEKSIQPPSTPDHTIG